MSYKIGLFEGFFKIAVVGFGALIAWGVSGNLLGKPEYGIIGLLLFYILIKLAGWRLP